MTIEDAAQELAFRLLLQIPDGYEFPDGETSAEHRLGIARALRIPDLKATLLRLAAEGSLRVRYPDGGYLPPGSEMSESSQVDIDEAKSELEANGWRFEMPDQVEARRASEVAPRPAVGIPDAIGARGRETLRNATERTAHQQAPAPVATSAIKEAFRDIWPGDIEEAFNKPRPWLLKHRKIPGRKGAGGDAFWDPVGIAADLRAGAATGQRSPVRERDLSAAFNDPALAAWRDAWTAYLEADRIL